MSRRLVLNWVCDSCHRVFRSAFNNVGRKCPTCKKKGTLSFMVDTRPRVADGTLLTDALARRSST